MHLPFLGRKQCGENWAEWSSVVNDHLKGTYRSYYGFESHQRKIIFGHFPLKRFSSVVRINSVSYVLSH